MLVVCFGKDEKLGRLQGKVALITGASSGIGRAMVARFRNEGARVAAISRRTPGSGIWARDQDIVAIEADITRQADIDRMFADADAAFGGVDIVSNVAGINDLGYPLHETDDARWDGVLDLDLKAPFRISRAVLPRMMARGGGVILNIASYAAVRGNHGASYTAAKHGLIGLTLSTAVGYARHGIRCNAINPGAVNTEIGAHSGGAYHKEGFAMFRGIVANLPVNWKCEPEEIASVAVFLCSDEAKHVNGAVVAVDGGMSAC